MRYVDGPGGAGDGPGGGRLGEAPGPGRSL
jgi:hypothetical protein